MRDIAKAINEAKKEKATTSIDKTEYDLDLQRAIQLSLRSGKAESEDEATDNNAIRLNPEQPQKLAGIIKTHGLVRGFMIEYAEMNDDDIQELIEGTQAESINEEVNDPLQAMFPHTDKYVLFGTPEKDEPKKKDIGFISDSDSEAELVEIVPAAEGNKNVIL